MGLNNVACKEDNPRGERVMYAIFRWHRPRGLQKKTRLRQDSNLCIKKLCNLQMELFETCLKRGTKRCLPSANKQIPQWRSQGKTQKRKVLSKSSLRLNNARASWRRPAKSAAIPRYEQVLKDSELRAFWCGVRHQTYSVPSNHKELALN